MDSNATVSVGTFTRWAAGDCIGSDPWAWMDDVDTPAERVQSDGYAVPAAVPLGDALAGDALSVMLSQDDGRVATITITLEDTWGMGPEDTAVTALIQAGKLRGGVGSPVEAYTLSMLGHGSVAITVTRTGEAWLATELDPLASVAEYVRDCWLADDDAPIGLVA